MTDEQIKAMVDRFLSWKLPEDFNPDNGISFQQISNPGTMFAYEHVPTGTNLFTATQAEAMVRHMLGSPGKSIRPKPDTDRHNAAMLPILRLVLDHGSTEADQWVILESICRGIGMVHGRTAAQTAIFVETMAERLATGERA